MTSLRIRTRLLFSFAALVLAPAFAHAEVDDLSKKDAPAGRQRLSPRPQQDSALIGTPNDNNLAPAGSQLGFGPMSGNPLFGSGVPVKSGN